MSIRLDVLDDGSIELMRPHAVTERNVFHRNLDIETAMILTRYYLHRDLERKAKDRFIPKVTREARRAFNQLKQRSPYHDKKP